MPTILLEYVILYLWDYIAYNHLLIQQAKDQCLVLILGLVKTPHAQEFHTTSHGGYHLQLTNNANTNPGYCVFTQFTYYFTGDRLN